MPRLSLSDTLNDSYSRLIQVLKIHDGDDYIMASLINISALMGIVIDAGSAFPPESSLNTIKLITQINKLSEYIEAKTKEDALSTSY
ncbi:hypothetical protein [Sodalis sp.]|uniref:hypothetical protein n=1 Tax=Sodalis sp. (in: enterobacteria) TaxID=1898979 RepID=UPI003873954F